MPRRHESASLTDAIRILFIIGTLDIGGAESQLVQVVTSLDRTRFAPVVCCLGTDGPLAETLRRANIEVHVLGFKGSRNYGLLEVIPHSLKALSRLNKLVRSEKPQIVHGVLFHGYVLAALIGRAARVPAIIASRRSLGNFKARKPHYLIAERIANRFTDLVIANSEAVRRDTLAREHLDSGKVLVVHNGVDVDRFDSAVPASEPGLGTHPRVVVVSNLIHYKGHEHFLRAWPPIVDRFPDATALLVGEGVMRTRLESLVHELGIRDSVKFLGTRRDVGKLLAASDLFVHPSLEEGFSNAILEAMSAGLPIIATNVGGTPEALADEVGVLVPPGNITALTDAILRLLAQPGVRRELGRRARALARERFDIHTTVRAYEDIYARIAAGDRLRYLADGGLNRCAG